MNGADEVVAAPAGPPAPLDWKFSQVFGERTAGEEVQEGNFNNVVFGGLGKRDIFFCLCDFVGSNFCFWIRV
jgi:hypothetical protein